MKEQRTTNQPDRESRCDEGNQSSDRKSREHDERPAPGHDTHSRRNVRRVRVSQHFAFKEVLRDVDADE